MTLATRAIIRLDGQEKRVSLKMNAGEAEGTVSIGRVVIKGWTVNTENMARLRECPTRRPSRARSGFAIAIAFQPAVLVVVVLAFSGAFAAAADHSVIVDFPNFDPNNITIAPGDRVIWQWVGTGHDVMSGACPPCSGDGLFASSFMVNGTFQHTFGCRSAIYKILNELQSL